MRIIAELVIGLSWNLWFLTVSSLSLGHVDVT